MRKELGKIRSVYFGLGGYQGACIGIHFDFEFKGSGVSTNKCAWDCNIIKHDKHKKWTEEDRDGDYARVVRFVSDCLKKSKVSSVDKLKGIPIEAEFDGMKLVSWRILEEVL